MYQGVIIREECLLKEATQVSQQNHLSKFPGKVLAEVCFIMSGKDAASFRICLDLERTTLERKGRKSDTIAVAAEKVSKEMKQ